jgi:hypothetical protein
MKPNEINGLTFKSDRLLVDPSAHPPTVAVAAQATFQELVELDAFTLVHDLTTAVARPAPSGQARSMTPNTTGGGWHDPARESLLWRVVC